MSNQTYKVAGVSRLGGEVKVRFAHEMTYVKGLSKAGNTDIELIEAPVAMTKPELVEFLKTTPLYENTEFRTAIDERADMYVVKAGKAAKAASPTKVTKTPKTKKAEPAPSLKAIAARATKPKATVATDAE